MYLILIFLIFSLQSNIFSMGQQPIRDWVIDIEESNANSDQMLLLNEAERQGNILEALKLTSSAQTRNLSISRQRSREELDNVRNNLRHYIASKHSSTRNCMFKGFLSLCGAMVFINFLMVYAVIYSLSTT